MVHADKEEKYVIHFFFFAHTNSEIIC